jgi:chaperonin GroEL
MFDKKEASVGGKILRDALRAPFFQIITNAGLREHVKGEFGAPTATRVYDTSTGEFVNMMEAGIVNPTNVEVNAVRNAISVAATALSAPTITTLPHENQAL